MVEFGDYLDRVYDANMKESEAAYAAHLKASNEWPHASAATTAATRLRSYNSVHAPPQLRPALLAAAMAWGEMGGGGDEGVIGVQVAEYFSGAGAGRGFDAPLGEYMGERGFCAR